jgi:hypothetical protein
MRKRLRAAAFGLLAVTAVLALAACGSSNPTVSSSAFITKCESDKNVSAAVNKALGGSDKLATLCHCVQSKLVADGFGNRTTDDNSADVKSAARTAGITCAQQLLSGG